jgi:DNA-binding IscR family transcriptional regulator
MTERRFSVTMHILTLLATAGDAFVASDQLAGSIRMHPVLIRKELANLRSKGLIVTREGKNGGSRLARTADHILLSDIYQAVRTENLLGKSKHDPNPDCPVGKKINTHLTTLYDAAEMALMDRLGKMNLQEFSTLFT